MVRGKRGERQKGGVTERRRERGDVSRRERDAGGGWVRALRGELVRETRRAV